jgi:hypothetical protein
MGSKKWNMLKYHNIKTVVDGITFDSKKESQRYLELKVLEKCGMIQDLRLQVPFEVCPKKNGNNRARYYVADFVYTEHGKRIIEDVKSKITRKNPVYSLKKALVLANYPEYIFRET